MSTLISTLKLITTVNDIMILYRVVTMADSLGYSHFMTLPTV